MEEELSFDNILGEQDIENLFVNTESDVNNDIEESSEEEETPKNKKSEEETTEVVDPETLFEEEQPESVGSGTKKEVKAEEDTVSDEDDGASPTNFYSSIANALAVDGIFPNLEDADIKKAVDAETFSNLIEAEINARLDERQRRISDALSNGVEPSDIRKYENTLSYISSLTDANIAEESENGERLRYQLITQDFMNKGYTKERADKLAKRSIDAGTDVEDAREALQSNREFFTNAYNKLLKEAQDEADAEKAERVKQAEDLKNSLLKDKQLFGDMELSSDIRKKAYDNISKPVYKDPETGDYLTAIQKYEIEHRADFLKYVGLLFTVTDGFKDFESFTKGKVKKELKKGLRELEQTLNSTRRTSGGSLKMVTSVNDDPESFIGKGFQLDI